MSDEAHTKVHEAIGAMLNDGEFAMTWVLTIDVAGPDGMRYLAHRAGGGADGTDRPMAWTAFGMLQASANLAADQVRAQTRNEDDA